MKKIIAILLLGVLLLQLPGTICVSAAGSEKTEPKWVTLEMVNNIDYKETKLGGVYYDGTFYISADKLAKYANADLVEDTPEKIKLMVFNRYITVNADGLVVDEIHEGTTREIKIPVMLLRGRLFVSVLHFYRYIGVDIAFAESPDSPVHLFMECPYTLYDALGEYGEDMEYYTFGLDEALKDGKISDAIKKLAALDTMLIHYDNSLTNHMFNASTATQDILSDCLIMSIREEGEGYTDKLLTETIQFGKDTALVADVTGSVMSLAENAAEASGKAAQALTKTAGNVFGKINIVAQAAVVYFEAVNAYKMYQAIPDEQGDILKNTLLRIRSSRNHPLYNGNKELFDSAVMVQTRIEDSLDNLVLTTKDATNDAVLAVINNGKQGLMTKFIGWPYAAVNAIYSITTNFAESDPVIGEYVTDEIQLTQARGCLDVHNVARQLFMEDFLNFMEADMYYQDEKMSMEAQEQLQADLLLLLKSAMAARRLMIDTVYANEEEKADMKARMQNFTQLVGKVEFAQLIQPGYPHTPTDDDLTWIEELTVKNNGGIYVEQNGNTYYWKISPSFYSEDVALLANYEASINPDVNNTLVCRDKEGKEQGILLGFGHRALYLYEGKLYWHWDNRCNGGTEGMVVHALDLQTGEDQKIGPGIIQGIDEISGVLVIQNENHIYMYDAGKKELKLVDDGGNVLQMVGEYIYFEDEGSASGTMELYRMSVLDRKAELMDTLKAEPTGREELSEAISYVCVNSAVYKDYLYLCNGVYAGTGHVFQGGQIGRIKLDGSGNYEQLDGDSDAYTEDEFIVYDRDEGTCLVYVLYGASTEYEYTATLKNLDNGQTVSAGSDVQARRGANSHREVYASDTGFMWNDSEQGLYVSLLTQEEVASLGFDPYLVSGGERNYTQMGFANLVGDKLYFSLIENRYVPEASIGWRSAFEMDHRSTYVKDMTTGEITKLYDF